MSNAAQVKNIRRWLAAISFGWFLAAAALANALPATNTFAPLPAPDEPPNLVPLTAAEQLGKDLFYDDRLSDPPGYACATCHNPQTAFTGPSSEVNRVAGPVPGVIPGRFGRRNPQPIAYSTFSPRGPYLSRNEGGTYIGGTFWDGRTPDTAMQARMPLLDANEMANRPAGPPPPHAGGYSPRLAAKVANGPYAARFAGVFGLEALQSAGEEQLYALLTAAVAVYEASAEVNQFSSKYDASTNGVPPRHEYTFTPAEENGRVLFFGKAQCFECHSSTNLDSVSRATRGRDTFTMYCYANLGVPRNPGNPFYANTNHATNPDGFNPAGGTYVDYGLGGNPNPSPEGKLFMERQPGDIPQFNGLFKAPTLRNVDLRPYPGFVRSYMHNGVFKSLMEVVHFYNKRSVATNAAGQELAFDWSQGPPAGYTPIFPPPEYLGYLANLQNVAALTPAEFIRQHQRAPAEGDIPINGQVGNLQLTPQEEADLVSFLQTLTDGYLRPEAGLADVSFILKDLPVTLKSGSLLEQIKAEQFARTMMPNNSSPTNPANPPGISVSNLFMPARMR